MSIYFDDYDKKYPNLLIEIAEYFGVGNEFYGNPDDRSVLNFCMLNKDPEMKYQPEIISRICIRMREHGLLCRTRVSGGNGWYDNYVFTAYHSEYYQNNRSLFRNYFNCKVYGFEYIYNMYRDIVIPLVWEKENGDYSAGTGFKYDHGIVTAKHCLTDVKNLQIKGYKAEELEGKSVFISELDGVDIAYIETGKLCEPWIRTEKGEIMQEVLVMGYPKIPAFTNFLTAEKATISSKASARITPTRGAISAIGYEYLAKMEALLLTARIRGGNSGGPVINENGCLVGIACQIPDMNPENGDYDDLGYGIAVPESYLRDIVNKRKRQLKLPKDFYRDYKE